MNNKDKNKISHLLKNGESVCVYYWEDDIVVRYQYVNKELMCYPKGKGRKSKELNPNCFDDSDLCRQCYESEKMLRDAKIEIE